MKRLPLVILVIGVLLATVVAGCGRAPRYNARLATVDSLMRSAPDSALALVEGVCRDSLAAECDRAYRDLLLTQARYRCYVTATSDSDINRALAYYRAHQGEREKLTRAYIYKGAVMEELGHPDSAMLYYKHAEATAAPDDYFNLGYAKMRIGALYRDHYAMDGKQIVYFERALECFNKTDNIDYQLRCMVNLGSLYCQKYPQKADFLLKNALPIAEMKGDTVTYILAVQNLIKNYLNEEDFFAARRLVQQVKSMNISQLSVPFCLYAASTYAFLHEPDTSWLYLEMISDVPIINNIDSLTYLETLRDVYMACSDTANYVKYNQMSKALNDSLCSSEKPMVLQHTEESIEKLSAYETKESQNTVFKWLSSLLLLTIFIALTTILIIIRRKKNYQNQIADLLNTLKTSESQLEEMRQLQQNHNLLNIQDDKLKDFFNSYLKLMQDVVEECYHQPNQKHTQRIKDLINFQKSNKETWSRLYDYLDVEYNGIISHTRANYPSLKDKDLLLIAMTALDFSYIQMAMILGYSNATTISSTKLRLAQKMGLNESLNEYITRFKRPLGHDT